MKQPKYSQALVGREYLISDQLGINNEVASARWEFIKALQGKLPAFGERLRKDVYPKFARRAGKKADYWQAGWKFSTWRLHSDRNNQLTPYLLAWAGTFNLAGEAWILESALQTLMLWHKDPDKRTSLDLQGFRQYVCGQILIRDDEHTFRFEDWGWDPQFLSWPGYRARVMKLFEAELRAYGERIRRLIKTRGGQRASSRYRVEHFEWLALYHCGGWSLDQILKCQPSVGDKTTISKGLHTAARLARLQVRTKRRKLKNP